MKKAIDAHDGTIEVSSTEGGGARFAILLPDAVRPAPEPSEEPGLLG